MSTTAGSFVGRLRRAALGLHRDERGAMLEVLLIAGVFVIPLTWVVLPVLWDMVQDYYLSFAYCIGWPFL